MPQNNKEKEEIKKLEQKACEFFGGEGSEANNALMTALWNVSGGKDKVYNFLEDTPKTTLICVLVDELRSLGYDIIKTK